MSTKKIMLATAAALFCLGNLYAMIDVSKFKTPKKFKGKVVSLCTTNVKMGIDQTYKGIVDYVAMPGTLFQGPTLDEKGNTVDPGTLLVRLQGDTLEANLRQKKADLETNEAHYNRCKRIVAKGGAGAISEQDLLQAKNDYLKAQAELLIAEKLLETTEYHARFDGVVNKVLFPGGYTTGSDRDVLEVSQLIPIGVEIEMSREEAFNYNINTPIGIIPLGQTKAVGPYRGITKLTDNGVMFILPNFRSEDEIKIIDGKEIPIISEISPVVPFNWKTKLHDKFALGINLNSIHKEGDKKFVLAVDGQKMTQPLNPLFKLKKVYIETLNLVNPIESGVKYVKIKDGSGLEVSDILLSAEETKDIKGDTAYFQTSRYLFMPNDTVEVIFDTDVKDTQQIKL